MPTYVLMTKLGSRSLATKEGRREAGQKWKAKVESVCPGIRWVAHYALLGPYDFMDLYEAPDDGAARASSAPCPPRAGPPCLTIASCRSSRTSKK